MFISQVFQTNRCIKKATILDINDIDDNDSISTSKSLISRKRQQIRILLYTKKSFLTCRSPADSFFLCQILQNVYNDTEQIPIRWCSLVDENGDETKIDENTHFKFDYEDILDINIILMEIKHFVHHADNRISLKKQDIIETNRLLDESMNVTTDHSLIIPKSKKRKEVICGEAARKLSFKLYVHYVRLFFLAVRKRRRTKNIDEIQKKPVVMSKAKLFKVQSNRFLKENLTETTYQVDPFFEDK